MVRHLGQRSPLPERYDPSWLEAIERKETVAYAGFDLWHAYEVCALCYDGLPVQGILKMRYSRQSNAIVESKSLKLYLYSLAHERLGATPTEVLHNLQSRITEDLQSHLATEVLCKLHTQYNAQDLVADYPLLESMAEPYPVQNGELRIASHLLASLCPVTGQPDWGTFVLHLRGERIPTRDELLEILFVHRDQQGFHEEICDSLYQQICDRYQPTGLFVACLYTRRGGIDICPLRATEVTLIPNTFVDVGMLPPPSFRR